MWASVNVKANLYATQPFFFNLVEALSKSEWACFVFLYYPLIKIYSILDLQKDF